MTKLVRGLAAVSLSTTAAAVWAQVPTDPGVGIDFLNGVSGVPLGGPLVGILMSAGVAAAGMWGMKRRAGRGLFMLAAGIIGLGATIPPGNVWAVSAFFHEFTTTSTPAFQSLSDEVGGRCDGMAGPGSEHVIFVNGSGGNATIKSVFTRDSVHFGELVVINNPELTPQQCAPGLTLGAGDSCTVQVYVTCGYQE